MWTAKRRFVPSLRSPACSGLQQHAGDCSASAADGLACCSGPAGNLVVESADERSENGMTGVRCAGTLGFSLRQVYTNGNNIPQNGSRVSLSFSRCPQMDRRKRVPRHCCYRRRGPCQETEDGCHRRTPSCQETGGGCHRRGPCQETGGGCHRWTLCRTWQEMGQLGGGAKMCLRLLRRSGDICTNHSTRVTTFCVQAWHQTRIYQHPVSWADWKKMCANVNLSASQYVSLTIRRGVSLEAQ